MREDTEINMHNSGYQVGTGMLELVEERARRRREYEERAVELVAEVLMGHTSRYREVGPDHLLAAAQVFATLAR